MKLTLQTDYALRILISLAETPERSISIQNLSERFSISKNHLMKTAQLLAKYGFIKAERGRNGGVRLAMETHKIIIGDVVRAIEPNMHMAECFQAGAKGKQCALLPSCKLKGALAEALQSFTNVLDSKKLSDIASVKTL